MNYEDIPGFQELMNDSVTKAALEANRLVHPSPAPPAPPQEAQRGRPVTIVTSTECPPQKIAWVYGNLVCNPVDRDRYAKQLEEQGHPVAEPTRQQLRATERWCSKRMARLAVAGMRKLP